jgi:alpha-ketoglutarate-dependent taurine dioxygenase
MPALVQAQRNPAPVELDAADARLAAGVHKALRDAGAAVVHGVDVGEDDALLAVVAHAAQPSDVGNGGGFIYDVMPRPEAQQVDVSSTSRRFPLHTDSTYLAAPHDVIALGCLHAPQDGGGESLLLHIDVAIEHLRAHDEGEDTIAALCDVAYPFLFETAHGERVVAPLAILARSGAGFSVRYRNDIITQTATAASIVLDDRHRAGLDRFEAVLADGALHATCALRPGDVLIADNRRVLHGRSAIEDGAHRVMRRVKAFA